MLQALALPSNRLVRMLILRPPTYSVATCTSSEVSTCQSPAKDHPCDALGVLCDGGVWRRHQRVQRCNLHQRQRQSLPAAAAVMLPPCASVT